VVALIWGDFNRFIVLRYIYCYLDKGMISLGSIFRSCVYKEGIFTVV